MGKYTITAGQNLYDAALHIYGSIEGITDLLVSNPSLSLSTLLHPGLELAFTDDYLVDADIAAYYKQRGISPANGERNVYFKEAQYPQIVQFMLPAPASSAGMVLSGSGVMEIDWGDNAPLQRLTLGSAPERLTHFFDNKISGRRVVRLYGDFKLRKVDFTALKASVIYILLPLYAEEVTLRGCEAPLDFLPILDGVYSLDLAESKAGSLLPVTQCRDLMRLDLSNVDVLREKVDEWLISLVREHYGRRSCEVILTAPPSGEYREPRRDPALDYLITSGMEAVWLLTHEPSWNESGSWRFDICGEIYTYKEEQ